MRGATWQVWAKATSDRYPVPRAVAFVDRAAFLALAAAAYERASRELLPPVGQPWAEDGGVWSGPEDFHDGLLHHVGECLRRQALEAGHLVEVPKGQEVQA